MNNNTQNMHNKVRKVRDYKLRQLNKILKDNNAAAPQGSKEWLARRMYSIGGSEMAKFMPEIPGNKPYGNMRSLYKDKLGLTNFTGSKQTRWGNLCEELTRI